MGPRGRFRLDLRWRLAMKLFARRTIVCFLLNPTDLEPLLRIVLVAERTLVNTMDRYLVVDLACLIGEHSKMKK